MGNYTDDPNFPYKKDESDANNEGILDTTTDSAVWETSSTQSTGSDNDTVASAPWKEVRAGGAKTGKILLSIFLIMITLSKVILEGVGMSLCSSMMKLIAGTK